MKPVTLNLGPIKIENVTQATIAFLGNKGVGKTSAMKMACYKLSQDYPKLSIIILDPLDVIRIEGFTRIRITRKATGGGAEMAKLLNKPGTKHLIISFPTLTQEEQNSFTDAFFEAWHRENCVVAIDEIHDFTPQSGKAYASEVERGVRHDRNHNAGYLFTSQRIAKCNKNVLELADVLVIHRMVGNNDRAAVEGYLSGYLPDEKVKEIMAKVQQLPVGEAYLLNFRGA